MTALAVHADWSVAPAKRWMAVAVPAGRVWRLRIEPVGEVGTLFARLRMEADGAPVALGVDFPLGLPRRYAERHLAGVPDFPAFLDKLAAGPGRFLDVCDTLDQVGPGRPFYPRRGLRGMTRLSHAQALDLGEARFLHRACDQATGLRPAGAPLFWTLGANQTGKAAIAAWRDLLLPALSGPHRPALWPFEGKLLNLLHPGRIAIAETYPADALRQLGLQLHGSKRRHADRLALAPALAQAMDGLGARPDEALHHMLHSGFGAAASGEDRLDCLLGVLCLLQVLMGRRTDAAPADPWIQRWEGWVLGQAPPGIASLSFNAIPVHY